MTTPTVTTTLHTAALFIQGVVGDPDRVSVRVDHAEADIQVFRRSDCDGLTELIRRAGDALGQLAWRFRESDNYPYEYVASGLWHGVRMTVFGLYTAEDHEREEVA